MSGRRPLYGDIVWCKYLNSTWWPAFIVPPPYIPDKILPRKKEPNQICIFFFGTHNYGWILQTQMYLYMKGDGEYGNKINKSSLKDAIAEAEQWMQRMDDITKKESATIIEPPHYTMIKANKMIAKYEQTDYIVCKCNKDDPVPCGTGRGCWNVETLVECDPDLCPAKEKCHNQNFHRGEQFMFEVKMTVAKGWGLFTKVNIPIGRFIMEYKGEVIDNAELNQRFSQATDNNDVNYYFLRINNNLYIDARNYGSESRFINHSCNPNAALQKWIVYSDGRSQDRIGFFALKDILKVFISIHSVNHTQSHLFTHF